MPAPARFSSGVTNVSPVNPFYMLPTPDPTRVYTLFDDFTTYSSANWTKTSTGAGTAAVVTTAGPNGILALTNSTGATDVNQIQLINETFTVVAGKQFWLKVRCAPTAGTMANFGYVVGFKKTGTTAVATADDGVFFRSPTGASTISAVISKAGAETTQTLTTAVTATYNTLAMYYNGKDEVQCWYDNGTAVNGSDTLWAKSTITTLTNLPTTQSCALTIATVNATAGAANVLSVDYVYLAVER